MYFRPFMEGFSLHLRNDVGAGSGPILSSCDFKNQAISDPFRVLVKQHSGSRATFSPKERLEVGVFQGLHTSGQCAKGVL